MVQARSGCAWIRSTGADTPGRRPTGCLHLPGNAPGSLGIRFQAEGALRLGRGAGYSWNVFPQSALALTADRLPAPAATARNFSSIATRGAVDPSRVRARPSGRSRRNAPLIARSVTSTGCPCASSQATQAGTPAHQVTAPKWRRGRLRPQPEGCGTPGRSHEPGTARAGLPTSGPDSPALGSPGTSSATTRSGASHDMALPWDANSQSTGLGHA